MPSRQVLLERFEDKFIPEPNTGCWIWSGSTYDYDRYGNFWNGKKTIAAHRMSWILYKNKLIKDKCVLHQCDNGLCVNPDHLFLGTQKDNVRDMDNKGRRNIGNAGKHGNHAKGEKNGQSKYSDIVINKMRKEYVKGITNIAALARKYSVSESQTRRIVWNQTRI